MKYGDKRGKKRGRDKRKGKKRKKQARIYTEKDNFSHLFFIHQVMTSVNLPVSTEDFTGMNISVLTVSYVIQLSIRSTRVKIGDKFMKFGAKVVFIRKEVKFLIAFWACLPYGHDGHVLRWPRTFGIYY